MLVVSVFVTPVVIYFTINIALSMSGLNEEQRDEVEALGSIFGQDFTRLCDNSHSILITPCPSSEPSLNHGNIIYQCSL